MSDVTSTDRRASAAEVQAHVEAVRRLAAEAGVTRPRLREDGTVVVHSPDPGFRQIVELSGRLSEDVGCYVRVIADDVPAADDAIDV